MGICGDHVCVCVWEVEFQLAFTCSLCSLWLSRVAKCVVCVETVQSVESGAFSAIYRPFVGQPRNTK